MATVAKVITTDIVAVGRRSRAQNRNDVKLKKKKEKKKEKTITDARRNPSQMDEQATCYVVPVTLV